MRQIVVTGGGTGIGLAIAAEFVRAGDSVTITGRREHVLKQAAGSEMGYACFDASDPAAVSAALDRLPARVDVLVNNAGRTPHRAGHPRQRRRLPGAVSWPGR
jgi:3-oxoacyl-[acyl-carrier protein] reductase